MTKGLKKVSADMKTKNRADRTGVVSTSAGRVLIPAKLLMSYSKQIILYFRALVSLFHVVMQSSLGRCCAPTCFPDLSLLHQTSFFYIPVIATSCKGSHFTLPSGQQEQRMARQQQQQGRPQSQAGQSASRGASGWWSTM